MITYSPKQQFQAHKSQREEWSQIVANPLFNRTITFALAEMISRGLSPESLAGVNGFIHTLQNMSEDPEVVKPMPQRSLTSYDATPTTTTKPKPPQTP